MSLHPKSHCQSWAPSQRASQDSIPEPNHKAVAGYIFKSQCGVPLGLCYAQLGILPPLPREFQCNSEQLKVTLSNSHNQVGFEMAKALVDHLDHHTKFGSTPW